VFEYAKTEYKIFFSKFTHDLHDIFRGLTIRVPEPWQGTEKFIITKKRIGEHILVRVQNYNLLTFFTAAFVATVLPSWLIILRSVYSITFARAIFACDCA
jgi:hypothetical protein